MAGMGAADSRGRGAARCWVSVCAEERQRGAQGELAAAAAAGERPGGASRRQPRADLVVDRVDRNRLRPRGAGVAPAAAEGSPTHRKQVAAVNPEARRENNRATHSRRRFGAAMTRCMVPPPATRGSGCHNIPSAAVGFASNCRFICQPIQLHNFLAAPSAAGFRLTPSRTARCSCRPSHLASWLHPPCCTATETSYR